MGYFGGLQQNPTYEKIKDYTEAILIEFDPDVIDYEDVLIDPSISKVSLVGVGMRTHAGIASKMFKCLAKNKVNIRMISTSEIKISVVIDQKNLEIAVQALHNEFKLEKNKKNLA